LNDSERAKLGGAVIERHYAINQRIITQGETGNGFYIIKKGTVVVQRQDEKGAFHELATLKDGDFFGETALINDSKRGASVTALSDVHCFYLEREDFEVLFGKNRLKIQFAKRQAISSETTKDKDNNVKGGISRTVAPPNAVREKDTNTIQVISSVMRDNVVFTNLDAENKTKIIEEMWKSEFKAGQVAVKQGDQGDCLFVVASGEFDVLVNDKKVATRGKGSMFGELALMYNSPRAATVIANRDAIVWVIDRFTFRRIVTGLTSQKFDLYLQFLNKVELLAPLADYERKKIVEALEEVPYLSNRTVFKQGDEGDAMYLVYSGEVKIIKDDQDVMRCKTGDYFGERALLTSAPRAASAVTVTAVQLLRLDRTAFSLLLGPLEEIMKVNAKKYESGPGPVDTQQQTESDVEDNSPEVVKRRQQAALQRAKNLPTINFANLKVIGTLGKGSFGFVQLVQEKTTEKVYALKAVSKSQIVQTGQQGHIMSEKRAMMMLDHPFIVKLFATHKDRNRLFFLLEPSLGGELFSILRERSLFDEEIAKFYAASVLLGFEYMHSLNIIYRDLKPENLLLDSQGFLMITDFGFAKDITNGLTWTLCGTPDYLAPEIVSGKGHGKGVDWWTLGIFIYEMLASYPPFYDDDPMKTYAKILSGNISFPSHFSKDVISLIKKLLHPKTTKRLGVVKGGSSEIKKHPWFKGFDFDALLKRRMQPPIIPKIKDNKDLSNFDDFSSLNPNDFEPYVDDGSNWDAEF
jgi:CRP-like cAMP-binding protein